MSINSFFAEQYGITARNPFYSGVRITEGYDFFPKGIPSLDVAYARLVDSSLALNQILESPSFEEVDDFYNPGTDEVSPGYILEAITIESFSRTEKRMAAVVRVFNKHLANSSLSALPPIVGTPKKSGSFAYVTVQLPFSDGQTVNVIFHAPEGDKKKITASDPIIAFRWLLNKRDITQVVAPEDGAEVSLDTIALRVTQLVLKNSARFEKQQKGAAEERKALEEAKEAVRGAEEKQTSLMDSIAKSKEDEQDLDARIRAIKTSITRQQTRNAELRAKLDALRAQRKQDEESHSKTSHKDGAGNPNKPESSGNSPEVASHIAKLNDILSGKYDTKDLTKLEEIGKMLDEAYDAFSVGGNVPPDLDRLANDAADHLTQLYAEVAKEVRVRLSFKEKREAQVSLNTSLTRLSSGGLSFKDKRTEQGNVATQLSILTGTPTSSSTLYDQLLAGKFISEPPLKFLSILKKAFSEVNNDMGMILEPTVAYLKAHYRDRAFISFD